MLSTLRSETQKWLTSKFDIIDTFDFVKYDSNPVAFFEWCKKWNKYSFLPRQRVVILNIDTDYYARGCSIGNNTYNFFVCCAYFQLPTEFFIYFSTQEGIHIEVQAICKDLNISAPTIVTTLCVPMIATESVTDTNFDLNLIKKPFVCLNRTQRFHRLVLLAYLREHELINKGIVSYLFNTSGAVESNNNSSFSNSTLPVILQTTVPFTRVNDSWPVSSELHQVIAKHTNTLHNQSQEVDNNEYFNSQLSILKSALVYVVTETVFNYPYPWISEKTIKGILTKRPMILVSSPNSIKRLQDLGFKTFGSLWDESYDSILNPEKRMYAIVCLIKHIANLPDLELINLAKKAESIVEFNFSHYRANFINSDLRNVY